MASISGYIEKRLKLAVNQEKSQVARSDRVKFLGMTIVGDTIAISRKALKTAMAKVKELTPRGTHLTLEKSIEQINSWYVGWSGYLRPRRSYVTESISLTVGDEAVDPRW